MDATPRRLGFPLALAGLFALAVGPGCNWRRHAWELGLGSFVNEMRVVHVERRGPYLDAVLANSSLELRVFAPADATCAQVLAPEATVGYVERGIGGRFTRGELACDAAGIGDPLMQNARRPRGSDLRDSPVPRAQATFREIYRDEDVIVLHGRFPLASRVGWARGDDSVAVVANTPACRTAIEEGVASMEYRPAGANTLTLVSREGPCRIDGLLRPPAGGEPDPGREESDPIS
jgi:hypothetical protein